MVVLVPEARGVSMTEKRVWRVGEQIDALDGLDVQVYFRNWHETFATLAEAERVRDDIAAAQPNCTFVVVGWEGG